MDSKVYELNFIFTVVLWSACINNSNDKWFPIKYFKLKTELFIEIRNRLTQQFIIHYRRKSKFH